MANLGMADSLILMVMALVVFGPRRLPQIGRQIGKLMYEFRKASNDFKFQMEEELRTSEDAERRKKEEERVRALAAPAQAVPTEADSQVSEARPFDELRAGSGAPDLTGVTETGVTENGLTETGVAEGFDASGGAHAPTIQSTVEAPIDETYPRIMPPRTGEQVAAARPNSLTVLAQAAREPGSAAGVDAETAANPESGAAEAMVSEGAPVEKTASEREQAAHHG
jgi:sec-independent protein translocase protein TatB